MGCQCMSGTSENKVWTDTTENLKPIETTNPELAKCNTIDQSKTGNLNTLNHQPRKSISYMISVANSEDRDRRLSMNSVHFNVFFVNLDKHE